MKLFSKNNYFSYFILSILAITIFLVSFWVYYPSLNYEFVWDDASYLFENPHIQKLNWSNIKWMFTAFYVSNWHPITFLSFAIDYIWQGGLHPWGFHLTNIIIHGLNSIGLFFLTILFLNITCYNAVLIFYPRNYFILVAAFISALLFSIHPQHVESVTWISERKDVLCQFFILLTIFFYIFYTRKTAKKINWYLASIFCFLLALMSKPMAVTLPVILLLLDIYPLRRTSLLKSPSPLIKSRSWLLLILEKIPFFLLTTLSITLTFLAQTQAIITLTKLGIFSRVINAIHNVFLYISKFIFPIALSPFYDLPSLVHLNHPGIRIILLGGFLLSILISFYYWKKGKYYILTAWFFYLVTLLPVMGVIQTGIQSAADRYAYLPTLPFYILIGTGVSTLLFRSTTCSYYKLFKFILVASIIAVTLILFRMNRAQQQIWKHDFVLWSYVLKVNPVNNLAYHNLAALYFYTKNYQKALDHVQRAIRYGFAWQAQQSFLAEIYIRLGRFDEAIDAYKNTLDIEDINIRRARIECIHYNLGWLYAKKKQFAKALQFLEQVPQNTLEYNHAVKLAIQIAVLNRIQADYYLNRFEQLPSLSLFDNGEMEQTKLDDLLTKHSYSFCFTRGR